MPLCSNKRLLQSPIRLHPQSAEQINICRHEQINTHHFSMRLGGREEHTHKHTHILTIDVFETLCSSTWNMPSYLPPLPLSLTHSLMHTYTLLCEPNNVRQALLSCDRAWNIETTEHYEPCLTSAVLMQFILLIYCRIRRFLSLVFLHLEAAWTVLSLGNFNLFSSSSVPLTLGSVCVLCISTSAVKVHTRQQPTQQTKTCSRGVAVWTAIWLNFGISIFSPPSQQRSVVLSQCYYCLS